MYFLALIVVVAMVIGLKLLKGLSPKKKVALPYRKQDTFLTPAERSFFGVLQLAIKSRLLIFAKVRVADILATTKNLSNSERQSAFNKIKAKHFDFVLCHPDNLDVLCVLELDDKSHKKASRQQRDEFLDSACEAASVPLIHFQAKAAYAHTEIEKTLEPFLRHLASRTDSPKPEPQKVAVAKKPQPNKIATVNDKKYNKNHACPRCSSNLVERVAKNGKHAGKTFMACTAYPKCRFVLNA
tara:strand:- start:181 stop:903 length:723 start_codon:yes stop_codon:yes gene_type:complete